MSKPKHRELLPTFIGQPVICLALTAAVALAACLLYAVGASCVASFQAKGIGYFFPSSDIWTVVLKFGLGFAVFNIAHDSATIDTLQGRSRLSAVTSLLVLGASLLLTESLQGLWATFQGQVPASPRGLQLGIFAVVNGALAVLGYLHLTGWFTAEKAQLAKQSLLAERHKFPPDQREAFLAESTRLS